jgi:hypothetical protein
MKNETETMTTTTTTARLTGDALLDRIQVVIENSNVLKIEATASAKAYACGYIKENGQPDFVPFYEALIEAKGLNEPTEDPEMSELEADLRERFSDGPVDAFIEYWGIDDLEYFEDAYQSAERPEDFARELVEEVFGLDVPPFVSIDWSDTWDNLRHDYIELDGYIFSQNW